MASSLQAEPLQDSAIDDFNAELEAATRTSKFGGRNFVLARRITDWFRSPASDDPEEKSTNAGRVLNAVLGGKDQPNEISNLLQCMNEEDEKCWLRTFAILLQLRSDGKNMGRYIRWFCTFNVVDRLLGSLGRSTFQRVFYHAGFRNDCQNLANRFWELQWEFCSQNAFNQAYGPTYEYGEMILPITELVLLKEGGSGKIYMAEVPIECIPPSLAAKLERKSSVRYSSDGEQVQQFALKVLDRPKLYENETLAYQALEKEDGIVKCFGFWAFMEKRDPKRYLKRYHLLLEWGSYDLAEFFLLYPPPTTTDSTLQFWERLSSIAFALIKIHQLVSLNHDGSESTYYGWHCDLKPGNILYCKEGHQRGWKIADPGFATFVRKEEFGASHEPPAILVKGGTVTYGGPERSKGAKMPASQFFDIWSLGCVFSEAATWVVLGRRGVKLFRLVRKSLHGTEGSAEPSSAKTHESDASDEPSDEIRGMDIFHDGTRMSKAVADWHAHLRHSIRASDPITADVLSMVEHHMLQGNPKDRLDAAGLAEKMKSLLCTARADARKSMMACTGYKPPPYFKRAISFEQTVEAIAVQERLAGEGPETWRNKYKSKAFIEAMKVPLSGLRGNSDSIDQRFGPRRAPTLTDVLRADYREARRILDEAGWKSGTLELPDALRKQSAAAGRPSPQTPVRQAASRRGLASSTPPTTPPSKHHKLAMSLMRQGIKAALGGPERKWFQASPSAAKTDTKEASPIKPKSTIAQPPQLMAASLSPYHSAFEDRKFDEFDSHFRDRNIAFLIDNDPSMSEHWVWARDLVSVLVAFLYGHDDGGIDLFFTSSREPAGRFHLPKDFVDAMNKMAPRPYRAQESYEEAHSDVASPIDSPVLSFNTPSSSFISEAGHTDIREALEEILSRWSKGYVKNRKKLTLIIFTDGVWAGLKNKKTVANEIIHPLSKWQDNDLLREELENRGLSIQFVRFGNNRDAIEELNRMDDSLTTSDGTKLPDIVDHEPADGNIYKMILGSLDPVYDDGTYSAR